MAFFNGASNVRITGGEFNIVKGNAVVYDESRHNTNTASFNAKHTVTANSHNNHSINYNGVDPRSLPSFPPPGQRDQGRSERNGPHDYQSYFPPSTVHPQLLPPQTLPPGSRTQNFDSFNTEYNPLINSYNNHSQNYGAPLARARSRGRWNQGAAPASYPQDDEDDQETSNSPYPPPPSNPPNQSSYSPAGYPSNPSHQLNTNFGGYAQNMPRFPQRGGVPYVNGHPPGSYSAANYQEGVDVRGFPPGMGRTFGQLMQQLHQEVGPEPQYPMPMDAQSYPAQDEREEGGSDEDSNSDEDDDKRMHLTDDMAGLSLNDELRPAFSHVKSDPQQPLATARTSLNAPSARIKPRHAESAQALPQRLKEPFVRNTSSAASPNHPALAAFGIPPSAVEGPIFREIHGDYTKADNSVNTTNIGSGNTYNTLVQDSYNDHSINVEEPKRNSKKQGHVPRKW